MAGYCSCIELLFGGLVGSDWGWIYVACFMRQMSRSRF
jgi:hypothetical protein